jgi:hypothetical protein
LLLAVLNEEMAAAGIRVFVGGLTPVSDAKSLRAQPNPKVLLRRFRQYALIRSQIS